MVAYPRTNDVGDKKENARRDSIACQNVNQTKEMVKELGGQKIVERNARRDIIAFTNAKRYKKNILQKGTKKNILHHLRKENNFVQVGVFFFDMVIKNQKLL